jgi:hypothetical protein
MQPQAGGVKTAVKSNSLDQIAVGTWDASSDLASFLMDRLGRLGQELP